MKYEFEHKKLNINEADKLKGELRRELSTPQGDVSDMEIEDVEKVLQKKKQDKRMAREKREQEVVERHEQAVSALSRIADGINGFIQKRQGEVQKVAGDVVARVANFPDIQKITGSVVTKVTNFPEIQKITGKVQTEVTNWPDQKDVKFPDVQKVEVLNQGDTVNVGNLPIGEGAEAGKNARPERYVPVRLTDGKTFYNALQSIASAVGSVLPFRDTQGKPAQANIDDNGNLKVVLPAGGSSGTQYTEGDTDASVTGTAVMWEDTSDTMRVASAAKPLPVNIVAGSSSGTEYTEGDTDESISGGAIMWEDAGNTLRPVSATHKLPVDANVSINEPLNVDGVVSISGTATVQATNLDIRDLTNASDSVTAHQGGTWNITNVSGTVSLPTGAATSAKQDTIIGHVDGIEALLTTIESNQLADNHNVTISNASIPVTGTFTIPKPLTVDGQVSISGTTAATQSGSWTVTANAGTNLNTSALALESGGNLAGAATSLAIVDDWDESDRAKVNIIAGQAGVTAGAGEVATNTPRVTLASDDPAVAALQTIDNAISGSEMQVDIVGSIPAGTNNIGDVDVVSSALPTGASTLAEQQSQTTHLATIAGDTTDIETAVELIDDTVYVDDTATHSTGSTKVIGIGAVAAPTDASVNANDIGMPAMTTDRKLHVSVQDALPAGTNAIGKLAANSGVDIGDVDVTSIAAGDNNIGNVDIVTVPTDPFGANADAAATAGSAGSMQAKFRLMTSQLDSIKTAVETLDNTVGGSELQVDVVTMPTVTVTATDLDVQSGGADLATSTQAGAIQTAVELIDDTVFVDDADWTADTSKHLLVGGVTQVATTANTDGDVTPLTTNAFRELRVAIPESDLATAGTAHVKKYYTNAGAVTDGIIWSPAAGKRWYVTDIVINVSAAATVTLEDDLAAGDSAVMKFELAANSGVSHSFNTPLYSGEDAADLLITTSAGNVYVTVTGYEI